MSLHRHEEEDRPFIMKAKRDGQCTECDTDIFEGEEMVWDPKEFKAYCMDCGVDVL